MDKTENITSKFLNEVQELAKKYDIKTCMTFAMKEEETDVPGLIGTLKIGLMKSIVSMLAMTIINDDQIKDILTYIVENYDKLEKAAYEEFNMRKTNITN